MNIKKYCENDEHVKKYSCTFLTPTNRSYTTMNKTKFNRFVKNIKTICEDSIQKEQKSCLRIYLKLFTS